MPVGGYVCERCHHYVTAMRTEIEGCEMGRRAVRTFAAGITSPLVMLNALAHNEWSAATGENPVDPINHAVIAAKLFKHTLDAVPLQQQARIDMQDLLDVMIQQIRGEL